MRLYWKEVNKGLDLNVLTDDGEEVNVGGVRTFKSGVQAIAKTQGYDPGRAIKGLGSVEEGMEFVLQFEPWREFFYEFDEIEVEPEIVKADGA